MNTQDGFFYHFDSNACAACGGKCCRGFGGYVWLTMEELEKMAGSRGMDATVFADQYVRLVGDRLSLREHIITGEHFCCFFDRIDHRCTIYQNRPKQCETFPFWDKFKDEYQELLLECPGIVLKTNPDKAL